MDARMVFRCEEQGHSYFGGIATLFHGGRVCKWCLAPAPRRRLLIEELKKADDE